MKLWSLGILVSCHWMGPAKIGIESDTIRDRKWLSLQPSLSAWSHAHLSSPSINCIVNTNSSTPPSACTGVANIGVVRCLCLQLTPEFAVLWYPPPASCGCHGHLHQSEINSLQILLVRVVVTSVLHLHLTDATTLRHTAVTAGKSSDGCGESGGFGIWGDEDL